MTCKRYFGCRAMYALAAALLAFALSGTAAELPPLTDPPTNGQHRGKLVWMDLVTADMPGAQRFYGALFGWNFIRTGDGPGAYTLVYKDRVLVAGMAPREPQPEQKRQARWVAYMSVPDVQAAAQSVLAQGGTILVPPLKVSDRGEMALVADPDGAPFGLLKSSSGDPEDFLPVEGDWIWALYQSPDASSAAAFYQGLGDYEVVPRGLLGQSPHFLLIKDGYARASIAEIPAERSGMRPDWLYFVRVENVADSLARVRQLGGRVLLEPRADLLDGRLAVIVDPAGAPLGVMAWTKADGAEQ